MSSACPPSPAAPTAYRAIRTEVSRMVAESKQLLVLVFDEAHHLRNEILEELRLLTNYRMDAEKRLCLLLVGLTELRRRLAMSAHESLAQRIVVRCHLGALRQDEVKAYLEHRLRIAGATVALFEPGAATRSCAPSSSNAPHAAVRTRDCQFRSFHEAMKSRRGYKRAIVAVAHKLLRTIYAMLRDRTPYADPGIDYEAISIGRKAGRWLQKLEQYGYVQRLKQEDQPDMPAQPA